MAAEGEVRARAREGEVPVVRRFLQSEGVSALGDGLWFSMWAVYLTSIQGVPPAQMGVAMGLGGGAGLLLALPLGTLADRLGAREMLLAVTVLRAAFSFVFIVVHSFWPLLAAAAFFTATETAAKGIKITAVYRLVAAETRMRVLAQARVVQHLCYAAGAGAAAWVLTAGTAEVTASRAARATLARARGAKRGMDAP